MMDRRAEGRRRDRRTRRTTRWRCATTRSRCARRASSRRARTSWRSHIRRVAEAHKVPIFESPQLARALYRNVDIGKEIPPRPLRRRRAGAHLHLPAAARLPARARPRRARARPSRRSTRGVRRADARPQRLAERRRERDVIAAFARNGLGVPICSWCVLAMMVLPLPPFLLDVLLHVQHLAVARHHARRDLRASGRSTSRVFPTVLLGVDAAAARAQRRVDARRAAERPHRHRRRRPA